MCLDQEAAIPMLLTVVLQALIHQQDRDLDNLPAVYILQTRSAEGPLALEHLLACRIVLVEATTHQTQAYLHYLSAQGELRCILRVG